MARSLFSGERADNAVPVAYLVLAIGLVAVLLPTALRPPTPQTPQTAQLSPDAPPDNKTEGLISSLNRASSGTAGAGSAPGSSLGDTGPGSAAGGPTTTSAAHPTVSCAHGFGNPPRQTESPYSALCVPPFHGDNGGATYKNVTGSQIKVGFWHVLGMPAERGPVPTSPQSGESAQLRTFRVLQQYWNSRYELYGRVLQLDAARDDPPDGPSARNAADKQDVQEHDFAVVHLSDDFCDEFSRRALVCYDGTATHKPVMESHAPGWWTLQMSHEQNEAMTGEYACRKLVGRNADFAGPNIQHKPRLIGVIVQSTATTGFRTSAGIANQIKAQCGYDVAAKIDLPDDDNGQAQTTAILKMEQANVTTIIMWSDVVPITVEMENADSNAYYPEWVMLNSNGADFNGSARLFPQGQASHMFGMSGWELPRPFSDTDCYKAYKTVDPANTPDQLACTLIYPSLEQVLNGISLAGPHLTPKTFEQGMFKYGYPKPQHVYEISGGYAPGDRSWVDTYCEMWWDTKAPDPQTGNVGAYRYTNGGQRYALGQIPRELKVFDPSDITGTQ